MNADEAKIVQAIIIGLITGLFSAGAIWGVIKTELKFIRRDLDEVRRYVWPDRRLKDNVLTVDKE